VNTTIRPATPADLPAINDIYNHYVACSTCTFQEEPTTPAERLAWFESRTPQHPVIVALEDQQIVGWGSISKFHARSAYRFTVEHSIYVRHDRHRRGIGAAILQDLITRARTLGHRQMIALICSEQTASINMHQKAGFTEAGRLREVGFKFNRPLDVIYMQLPL
jgi:phosphinothricin acetyltransferase